PFYRAPVHRIIPGEGRPRFNQESADRIAGHPELGDSRLATVAEARQIPSAEIVAGSYAGTVRPQFANLGVFAGLVFVLFIPVLLSNLDESLGFIRYAGKWVNNAAVYEIFTWLMQQAVSLLGMSANSLPYINRWGILIIYLIIYIILLRKAPKDNLQFFYKGMLIVAVLYLISPTQFPWYYTWMLPLLTIRPKVSLLIYPLLLPLYQLNYLTDYIIYIEHLPILILFLLELKGVIWKEHFNYLQNGNSNKIIAV
ncbi:MAG: hypothetical protein IH819_01385, partial [Bacteroidetes bacterium]|nr:hypothetical protein [Bacteroidota bacterium]